MPFQPETKRSQKPTGRGHSWARWLHVLVLAALVAFPSAAILRQNWAPLTAAYDRHVVAAERFWRRAYWRLAQPLPGTPALENLERRLEQSGHKLGDPVLVRIFKREFELEIWLRRQNGRYARFVTYPICRFSGRLGPKLKQGDRQAPEGFYAVSSGQLNPNSRWHRSFNLGFPNAYDRSHGRTGTYLMVHGGCSSTGCYAMTNAVVDEIWRLVTAALRNGQRRFQVQAFPFRMTTENLKARTNARWSAFWRDLKTGHDLFEATQVPPVVNVCRGRYMFTPGQRRKKSVPRIRKSCPKPLQEIENEEKSASGPPPLPIRQPTL